jgi:hypothetical protein
LHVATSSSTWAFELDRMSTDIAERLAEALGSDAPQSFRFRPGPLPEASPEAPPEESVVHSQSSPEVAAAAARLTAEIGDPDLRELVARAARASLRKSVPEAGSDRGFW